MGRFNSFEHADDWETLTKTGTKRQTVRENLSDLAKNFKKHFVKRSRTISNQDGDIQVYEMVQE